MILKMLEGTSGRMIRAIAATLVGALVAKYQNNVWFLSLTPFLQTVSKYMRDKNPGYFEWLPF